jgi:hypothetical protein
MGHPDARTLAAGPRAPAGLLGGLGFALAQEGEPVALELVLAFDSSSSVSAEEFDLQRQGIAQAFRDPAVRQAIADLGEPGLAAAVAEAERLLTNGTNQGGAMRTALAEVEAIRSDGRRKMIEVSGDGFTGLSPRRERAFRTVVL